jgi:hypothetical protein
LGSIEYLVTEMIAAFPRPPVKYGAGTEMLRIKPAVYIPAAIAVAGRAYFARRRIHDADQAINLLPEQFLKILVG